MTQPIISKPKRERPKVVRLTDRAAERVQEIMAARPDDGIVGVKVGVKNGGCAGMEYTMDYVHERDPMDEVVEDKGVTIFIDAKAVLFLFGSEVDFETTKLKSGFTFKNPNQTDACGCGESVTITPVSKEQVAEV